LGIAWALGLTLGRGSTLLLKRAADLAASIVPGTVGRLTRADGPSRWWV
jgi:hypothetical protein